MKKRNVLLLGGDLRQYYMAESLVERGFAISYYGVLFPKEMPEVRHCRDKEEVWKKLREKDTVLVLPVSSTSDGVCVKSNSFSDAKVLLEEIVTHVKKGQCVCGGNIPIYFQEKIKEKGARIIDFIESDIIVTKEAVSTAEGAIVEAELLSDEAIFESGSLILGFGRYGKALADRLKALGSNVTIAVREEEVRRLAQVSGFRVQTFPLEKQEDNNWNFVFHTTPEFVLDAETLNLFEPEVVIVDIAGSSGSVDYDYARKQGIMVKHCVGLPGKYTAKTAGETLAEELCRELFRQ